MNEKTQTPIPNSGSAASGATHEAMDRFSKSAHSGIDSASDAVHPAVDRVASTAHRTVENLDNMAGHAADAIDKAGVKGEELIASGTSYMHKHPVFALGLAVTAGYLLSRLLESR